MKIKNLALKGGGVKGIAYVGALKELDERGHYSTLENVSGTSAGAIVAAMIAVGYSPDEIDKLMRGLNFKKFKSGWNPFRLFTKFGLYSGDYILDFIHEFLEKSPKKLSPNATFKELNEKGCINLIVFASDLNTHTIKEFSFDTCNDCIVAEAVRASMSIPLFFKGWKFTNSIPDNNLYVDGGVVFNYPLSLFDNERFHKPGDIDYEASMGLFLEAKEIYEKHPFDHSKHKKKPHKNTLNFGSSIFSYIKYLFETLLNSQNIDFMEDSTLVHRTAFIDDLGISATKFDLTPEDMNNLVNSGHEGAKLYFEYKEKLKKHLTSNQIK